MFGIDSDRLKSRFKINWVTTKSRNFNERVKKMEKVLIRLTLAVGVIVFMTPAAHSELLVYEPFDYPVGSLVGNGGAFGLDGVWEDWGQEAPPEVVRGSLVHPTYEYIFDAVGNQTKIVNGDVGVSLLTPFGDDGRDYWISFLYQRIDPETYAWIKVVFPEGNEDPLVVVELHFGYPALYSPEYGSYVSVSGVTDPSAVMWIVIKAETSGNHNSSEMVYMWVDPDPKNEPDIADAGGSVEYDIPKNRVTDFFLMGGIGEPAAYNIDEIKIGTAFEDVGIIPKCENASNPSPENGQIYVDVNLQELAWEPPTCVDVPTYDVYLDADPNLGILKAEGITETTYQLPESLKPLNYETTYYWRVDVIDANEVGGGGILYEGRTWHFTTWAENPTIITQPESTTIPAGSGVQFSIEVINSSEYQWYVADTPDGPGTLIPDCDLPVLILTDVQLADEGYYYCRAINPLGETYSERARLLTERPMAHWKFEDNLDDLIDSLNNGVAVGSIAYAAGIDDQAAVIAEPDFITTANDMGELTEITVSMWISPDTLVGEQALLAANGTWDTGTVYINTADDQVYGRVIEDEDISIVVGPALIAEGVWNHCVFVYDTSTQWSGLYLNGELIDQGVTSVAPILPPLSIGAISAVEGLYYNGLIDDLRIYDYRLSDLEIASLYADIVPEANICLANPDYDLNENCLVDLEDLGLVASQWLECNIVPTCLP